MGRRKKPIRWHIQNGSHMSQAEIVQRLLTEVQVPFRDVKAPDYLPEKLKVKFNDIAEKLVALGLMTELDEDCLAAYVIAHANYLAYTQMNARFLAQGDLASSRKILRAQAIAFNQCQSSARALGMDMTSRATLIMPELREHNRHNKFEQFLR